MKRLDGNVVSNQLVCGLRNRKRVHFLCIPILYKIFLITYNNDMPLELYTEQLLCYNPTRDRQ